MHKKGGRGMKNLKYLEEQRADLQEQMQQLLDGIEKEERAFNEDENKQFSELEGKIKLVDDSIAAEERARKLEGRKPMQENKETLTTEQLEERAFANYIRKEAGAYVEQRAGEQNLTMSNNGAVIPTTIANRIITEVKDVCPILQRVTMYSVEGTLKVPVWGLANTTHDITVAYSEEFTELTADTGKFTSIDLGGYLVGALTLIGRSVANNAQVDVVSFVVSEMSKKIAEFIEKELLVGTSGKATGALDCTNTLTTASATAITTDELVELQSKIKQVYQGNACWIMNPTTFTLVKKLKIDGKYALQDDYTSEFPYRLLGKPVFVSDNMPTVAAGNKSVLYGDLSGLSVNMRENISIQILMEKYATMHAMGVVSWFEFDSKVTDNQKLAVLVQKAS
jgi:HK97 family phage major capsid protein